ncbi:MAG: hypothetical protein QGH76_00180 [Phycisphaerales bacterium]|nr:hypothetical protein [Phycisphaerales bacterium]
MAALQPRKTISYKTWVAIAGLLVVATYIIWIMLALARKPTITVDYLAKLNEVAAAVPEPDRAWPRYQEVLSTVGGEPQSPAQWPGDPGWEVLQTWVDDQAHEIEQLRQIATMPGMGNVLTLPSGGPSSPSPLLQGSVISVNLPALGGMRSLARLLMIDAREAMASGDGDRAAADIIAILGIARHLREHPILINDLVSLSLFRMALTTAAGVMERAPAILSDAHLAVLATALAETDDLLPIRITGERYMMLDILQRIYTDDGEGDGWLIPGSLGEVMGFAQSGTGPSTFLSTLVAPAADCLIASRREMREEADRFYEGAALHRGDPLWQWEENPHNAVLEARKNKPLGRFEYVLLDTLAPALDQTALRARYAEGWRDAALAAIAIEQFRRREGRWPATLAEAMENPVPDPWAPQPMGLVIRNGKPVLYSLGSDRDDDGGTPPTIGGASARAWAPDKGVDGDWILWPEAD